MKAGVCYLLMYNSYINKTQHHLLTISRNQMTTKNITKSVTTAKQTKIADLYHAGVSQAKIAKQVKLKQADVKAMILQLPVVQRDNGGVTHHQAVIAPADTKEEPKQVDKLAAMMLAAAAQKVVTKEAPVTTTRMTTTVIKTTASPAKDENGKSLQRRNRSVATRAIGVFISPSLNMCWIGTHLGFATKTEAGSMKIMQNAPQKALAPLQTATDVQFIVEETDVPNNEILQESKARAYDKYAAKGLNMLSTRPKITFAPANEVVLETEQVAETA